MEATKYDSEPPSTYDQVCGVFPAFQWTLMNWEETRRKTFCDLCFQESVNLFEYL